MTEKIQDYDLRLITDKDARALAQTLRENRAYLSRFIYLPEEINEEEISDIIKKKRELFISARAMDVGLFDGPDLIGLISVSIDKYDKRAELGYWLAESFTGKGLMSQAVKRLVNILFKFFSLNKLIIKASTDNERSIALAKRLNFKKEARLRSHQLLNGDFKDLYVFSLLREEWEDGLDE